MKYLLQASHCLLLIILTACSSTNKSNSKSGHVTTVSTEKAMRTNISSYIKTIGITVSDYTINIRPQVSGQLLKTHFSDGQWVKKGDLLYSIDPRLFDASLKEAEARVQSAQAELKTTQLKYNRSLELEKSKFISKQDLQDIDAQLATAKANLTTAKAEKYKAEVELGYTKIHAAMDGKTSMHFVDMGNIISPSMPTPLATLIDMDPIYFHLVIPQSEFETFKAFFEKNKEKNQNTIAHIELQDG